MDFKKKPRFGSSWGFVLASVGSAVGMANVWGFPAKMGAHGGAAFLIAYLIFIALFSTFGLAAEFAVGRRSRSGVIGAYHSAWQSRKPWLGHVGSFIGWLPLLGLMCIAIGYAVIISYILKAFTGSITGELMRVDPGEWFGAISTTQYSVVPFHIIVVLITILTLFFGVKSIERSNKIMMPAFFVIFFILAIRVAFLPGAAEGYKFMFTPDWSALADPMTWIWAMGQAFFSLSVTGGGMVVYGSYLGEQESVVPLSVRTAVFDTIAALVAAMVIIPACFAYDLDVGAGPSLLFVTLPRILQDIEFGQLFAIILYLAMIFAGVSSLQNMFEAVSESLCACFPRFKRVPVLIVIGLFCLLVGLNMETINLWGPWMDIVSIYIIPVGATLGAISWYWILRKENMLYEINKAAGYPYGVVWHAVGRFVYVPFAVFLCLTALILQISF